MQIEQKGLKQKTKVVVAYGCHKFPVGHQCGVKIIMLFFNCIFISLSSMVFVSFFTSNIHINFKLKKAFKIHQKELNNLYLMLKVTERSSVI